MGSDDGEKYRISSDQNREGQLEGLITIGDIAKTYMDTTDSYLLSRAKTQYRRIAETIAGTVVEGNEHGYFTKEKFWWELQIRKCSKPILNRMT